MAENTNCTIIDVKPIYSGAQKELDFSFEMPTCDFDFSDIEFLTPVNVFGKIRSKATGKGENEGYVELTLTVSADIKASCARCLEDVLEKLEYTKVYGLTTSIVSQDSEDYITTENSKLDALELSRTLFILNVPMRFLCSEDCKGICSECGRNLNLGECDCGKSEVDERLAILKNLKFD